MGENMYSNGEFTINWHITWKCNYKCRYCFTRYNERLQSKEIISDETLITKLLDKLTVFKSRYPKLRLNIAGGEPLLSEQINNIIEKARMFDFNVSIITNAYYMKNLKDIKLNLSNISMLGISIDSICDATNKKVGRCCCKNTVSESDIVKIVTHSRNVNPNIKIKINTVVTEYNYKENFVKLIENILPDKWKVFQALSLDKTKIYCSDENFDFFVQNHKQFTKIMYKETAKDMINSYVMIDPYGRFFQHKKEENGYDYTLPLMELPDNQILNPNFDEAKYFKRYMQY